MLKLLNSYSVLLGSIRKKYFIVEVVFISSVRAWKCVPTAISGGVDISEVPGCHLIRQISSQ